MTVFLLALKVFYEPLVELNTERQVKLSAVISKKAPNNILFIVKFENINPRVKCLEFRFERRKLKFPQK